MYGDTSGQSRGYTYHSKKYRHYSRLDYFLVKRGLAVNIKKIIHHPAHILDHSAVTMTLQVPGSKPNKRWILKRALLLDEEVVLALKKATSEYFLINKGIPTPGVE